jgi:hypothetical protein
LIATWDTDEPNIASADLALSLGFVEQPSFIEWSFPDRGKPKQSTGVWAPETIQNGIVRWMRG